MPKPPLITSIAGQRLAVAVLMAVLLAGSLAAAYAFTTTGHRGEAAQEAGWYELTLPNVWEEQKSGPLAQVFDNAHEFHDATRLTRRLAVGTLTSEEAMSPQAVLDEVMHRLLTPPVEVYSQYSDLRGPLPRVEVCVRTVENGVMVQRQFAVVTRADQPTQHAVLHMEDVVSDPGTFQQNQMAFHDIVDSLTILP